MNKGDKVHSRVKFFWDLREELFQKGNGLRMYFPYKDKTYSFSGIKVLEVFDIRIHIQFFEDNKLRLAIQTEDENIYKFLMSKQKFFKNELDVDMDYRGGTHKQLFMEETVDLNNPGERKEALRWVAENTLKIKEILLR